MRFGIVGGGAISRAHVRSLEALHGVAELVAVADPRPGAASEISTKTGCKAFESQQQMLASTDIEAVCICAPPNVHADLAVAAMEAGRHAIIEKPAEVSLAATDRIIAASKKTGRFATIIAQHRFDASSIALRKAVELGRFGRLTRGAAQVRWWRPQEYFDSVPWRGSLAVSGGGSLISQSIHTLDLMLWTMGPVDELFAYGATLAHERIEVEDTLSAVLKFRNGALGVVEASITAYPGLSAKLEVSGERGSAVIDKDALTYFHAAAEDEQTGPYGAFGDTNRAQAELESLTVAEATAYPKLPIYGISGTSLDISSESPKLLESTSEGSQEPGQLSSAHQSQIRDFAEAIRQNRPPAVSLEDARYVLEVIFAIHDSARSGRSVKLQT